MSTAPPGECSCFVRRLARFAQKVQAGREPRPKTTAADRLYGHDFLRHALEGENTGFEAVGDVVWNIVYHNTVLGRNDLRSAEVTESEKVSRMCRTVPGFDLTRLFRRRSKTQSIVAMSSPGSRGSSPLEIRKRQECIYGIEEDPGFRSRNGPICRNV